MIFQKNAAFNTLQIPNSNYEKKNPQNQQESTCFE